MNVSPARLLRAVSCCLLVAARLLAQAEGALKWPGGFNTAGYIVSSPALGADGTIYVGAQDKYLYAIAPNGAFKWRFLTGDWIDSSPAVAGDGTIYFGSWDGKLYALTPAGVKKWEYSTGAGSYIYSSPALGSDGTIYFGAGDGNFYALRPDGTLKWSYPAGDWIDSSPALANGLIYYGSWDGNVYALRDDGDTAKEAWRFTAPAPILSSPAIGRDGTVFIGANDGKLYALDGASGAKRWEYLVSGTLESSPVVAPDGTIYIGSSTGLLHAVLPDGTRLWTHDVTEQIVATPAVRADGTIIFGAGDAAVHAVRRDGTALWKFAAADWVDSSPVVAPDGTIYVGSFDKKLYALNGSGSAASAFSEWPMFRRAPTHRAQVAPKAPPGRLANLSTRALAGPGINLIPGFVVAGNAAKPFLVRAIGPTLVDYKVSKPLPDPVVELLETGRALPIAQNNNWDSSGGLGAIMLGAGAFALPENSKDAVVHTALGAGLYTARASSNDDESGLALVEVYDAAPANANARLVNLSTRGQVGLGDAVLTSGMVIDGNPLRLLVRAVGPTLAGFGVPDTLARPTLMLFSGQTVLATNTGWAAGATSADLRGAAAAAGGFALNEGSTDSALLITLNPGAYTAQVSGVGDTTGEILIEVYIVP